jgi:hypothetical protein
LSPYCSAIKRQEVSAIGCNHKSCGSTEKIWMPHTYQDRECGLKPHQYCTKCGLIKGITSERIHSVGYFINILASLGKDYKIAQVQMRLISQDLEKSGIDDSYGIDKYQQEKLFLDIVMRYLNVPERAVSNLLNSCNCSN